MCTRIYLINVGANTSHRSQARSPIFEDSQFVYVSYPENNDNDQGSPYPAEMHPYVRDANNLQTHNDPDWVNLTYGNVVSNGCGGALRNVVVGDILLFWGLLWQCNGQNWDGFIGEEKSWYLFGALRVGEIIKGRQNINNLPQASRARVQQNAHYLDGHILEGHRVFLGDQSYSRRFCKAVDLGASNEDGLIYVACTSADGNLLPFNGRPRWYSSLRPCRRMWDLNDAEHWERVHIVRQAIQQANEDFDLLQNIAP